MPENPSHAASESSHGTPWYESNVLWGGIGIVCTVVAAMKHNLLWMLWFAWLCFLFNVWSVGRRYYVRRWWIWICGTLVISAGLFGVKIWLSAPPQVASAPVTHPPTPQSKPVAPVPATVVRPKSAATQTHVPKTATGNPGIVHGSDNTIVGNDHRSIEGNGNTIVGPTDASGNTILNRGGTAIGNGANADQSSIAIGAHANAGATPQPTYEQKCEGSACAQGPGSQATFNQFGPPEAKIIGAIEKVDDASGYKVEVSVTVESDWPNAAFVVKCNRPCTGDSSIEGIGTVGIRSWIASENPDWVVMKIEIPPTVPKGSVLHWWVRSNDGQPITITSIQKADIRMASQ